jgi:hypothetical protein
MPWTNRARTTRPFLASRRLAPKAAGLLGVAATPSSGVVAIEPNL